jgi:poly(3-hydroxybutyrate) depolymerase
MSMLQVDLKMPSTKSIKPDTTTARSCHMSYEAGLNLVQLPEIGRQFLLFVPQDFAPGAGGVPLVFMFHGFSDSPWYANKAMGVTDMLERYGWLGILPFGLRGNGSDALSGIRACCPPGCDEECCKEGKMLSNKSLQTACGFDLLGKRDVDYTDYLVSWAANNTCADTSKMFVTGFSNGGAMTNMLGCLRSSVFRGVAPVSGEWPSYALCHLDRPLPYVSMCGSKDDEAHCQITFAQTAKHFSKQNNCTGAGPKGSPIVLQMSDTTTCTQWSQCAGGSFVEYCLSSGLAHDPSGHLRPDDISYLRPGSDLDFTRYMFQKFSLLVNHSILFYGHPTSIELKDKESKWPPPKHTDHEYLRNPSADAEGQKDSAMKPIAAIQGSAPRSSNLQYALFVSMMIARV